LNPTLHLVESDLYYFDEKSADRVVKFIETCLFHWEDKWEGLPFTLSDYQRKATRDIFGWKRRDNNLRRFREVFALIGKGNGKSAWLSAIGCYMALADGEAAAHVISAATDHKQADITFDFAKKVLKGSPRFKAQIDSGAISIKQYQIDFPRNSKWTIESGTVQGKAGAKPTCLLMDELWEAPNRKLYDSMTRNAKKRSQSLVIIASNAGMSRDSICYELYTRAKRVLRGESKDDTLYPIIFESAEKDDPASPETWAKANPALDQIITTETLTSEWIKASEVPGLEAEFRRLHLSQWVQGANKWLDMNQWDKCTRRFSTNEVTALPLVLALDMSLNDDLTCLSYQFIGQKTIYTKGKFWLPRSTALEYEQRDSIPFTQWENEKHIKLVDSETIDPRVQARIAKFIISLKDKYNLLCLAYDRNRASNVIALCEQGGVTCIPVPQNWVLSPAAEELTRLLKSQSIVISPNPIARWCASNVEATTDKNGNIHIQKEGRTQTGYKGRRGSKIDFIAALVTGLSQVRLEQMQPTKKPSTYERNGLLVL
jgi:phage terminase large subunit-like protein